MNERIRGLLFLAGIVLLGAPAGGEHPGQDPTGTPRITEPRDFSGGTYLVRPGDTLSEIALDRYGHVDAVQRILEANPRISEPDRIFAGETYIVPAPAPHLEVSQALGTD